MEMELINLLRILRRWLWLIVLVALVSGLTVWLSQCSAKPIYEARVKLQLTTPQQTDVTLYDEYRYVELREEMALTRNNFAEVLQAREVYDQTVSQLGLAGEDAAYMLETSLVRDTDFIYIIAQARTASLAEEIANAHTKAAMTYFGELRAKPANAAKDFFAEQLQLAKEELQSAEDAFADFQVQNGAASLEDELVTQQNLLEQLRLERDRAALAESNSGTGSTAEIDKLIVQRRDELERLVALAPRYNTLAEDVRQTREKYQHLLEKYTEAELKANEVQATSFVQVVEPAGAPSHPVSDMNKILVLAIVGGLGLGILLAFVLEYITGFEKTKATPADAKKKAPLLDEAEAPTETANLSVPGSHYRDNVAIPSTTIRSSD